MIRSLLRAARLAAALLLSLGAVAPATASAALPPAKRAVLARYLDAIVAAKYDAAFALLSAQQRKYFATAANYASIYAADRLKVDSYTILGSQNADGATVALVAEKVDFFDHARQLQGSLTAKVPFGIVSDGGRGFAIKDPYHPWRAIAPPGWSGTANGVTVTVRKLSFFTGRIELLMTFENRGDGSVTILPYGRSVLRDDTNAVHAPIETKLASLTDKTLYTGLVLAASARYTGTMTFFTSDRFEPKTLALTVSPVVADGGDAPFEIPLPALALAH